MENKEFEISDEFYDDFEPHTTNRFLLEICDEEGNSLMPRYVFNSFSDKGGERVIVKSWVVENPPFFDYYKDLVESGKEDQLIVTLLSPDGENDLSITYEDVELEKFYPGRLGYTEEDDDPIEFYYEFSFEEKRFINERSE